MALTPFHQIPYSLHIKRFILPAIILFVFLFFFVGVVANSPTFQEQKGPSEVIPFWTAAFDHYDRTISAWLAIPGYCYTGNTVNEFQQSQCAKLWFNFSKLAALAFCPLVVLALGYLISRDQLKGLFERAQKRAQKGKTAFLGKVTDPPEAPGDVFSWLYGLQPVMVQLQDQSQVKVYVVSDLPIPSPGTTLVALDKEVSFGEKRHLAMLYAPHMAIVKGGD